LFFSYVTAQEFTPETYLVELIKSVTSEENEQLLLDTCKPFFDHGTLTSTLSFPGFTQFEKVFSSANWARKLSNPLQIWQVFWFGWKKNFV